MHKGSRGFSLSLKWAELMASGGSRGDGGCIPLQLKLNLYMVLTTRPYLKCLRRTHKFMRYIACSTNYCCENNIKWLIWFAVRQTQEMLRYSTVTPSRSPRRSLLHFICLWSFNISIEQMFMLKLMLITSISYWESEYGLPMIPTFVPQLDLFPSFGDGKSKLINRKKLIFHFKRIAIAVNSSSCE